jgi:hypothetical protein
MGPYCTFSTNSSWTREERIDEGEERGGEGG